jgi:hypothetical protein
LWIGTSNIFGSIRRRLEAQSASRFIRPASADKEPVAVFDQSLRPIRGRPAANADCESFRDVFGHRQQLRHRIEWPAPVILVQPGNNDAFAGIRKSVAHRDEIHIEELAFIYSNDLRPAIQQLKNVAGVGYQLRFDLHLAVADDVVLAIPVIHLGFEDLNPLSRYLRAAQTPYKFLAFSAEHAAANDFDPAQVCSLMVELLAHMRLKGRQLYL